MGPGVRTELRFLCQASLQTNAALRSSPWPGCQLQRARCNLKAAAGSSTGTGSDTQAGTSLTGTGSNLRPELEGRGLARKSRRAWSTSEGSRFKLPGVLAALGAASTPLQRSTGTGSGGRVQCQWRAWQCTECRHWQRLGTTWRCMHVRFRVRLGRCKGSVPNSPTAGDSLRQLRQAAPVPQTRRRRE